MCCPVLKAPKLQPVSKFQHFLAVCQLSGLKYIDAEMQTLDVRTNGFGNFYKKNMTKTFYQPHKILEGNSWGLQPKFHSLNNI
jgi:hypothetical protein